MSTSKPLIVVAVALLGAGCGSAGPPASSGQSRNPGAAAYRYADCMRSHGVTGFPDPHVHVNGNQVSVIQGLPPSAAASPHFKSAQKACQGIIPAPGNRPTPVSPEKKAALLAFARCMRDRGLSAFPDPNSDGNITSSMLSAAGVDLRSHQFVRDALGCVPVAHGFITAADVQAAGSGAH